MYIEDEADASGSSGTDGEISDAYLDDSMIDDEVQEESDTGLYRKVFNQVDQDEDVVEVIHPCPKGRMATDDYVISPEEEDIFKGWIKRNVYNGCNMRYAEYCNRHASEERNKRLANSNVEESMDYYGTWEWLSFTAICEVWEQFNQDYYKQPSFQHRVVATLFNRYHRSTDYLWDYVTNEGININVAITEGEVFKHLTCDGICRLIENVDQHSTEAELEVCKMILK